jgi:hypothetical protein
VTSCTRSSEAGPSDPRFWLRGLLEVLGEAYLAESLLGAGVEHGRLPEQPHSLILVLAVGQHVPNAPANSGSGAVAAGDKDSQESFLDLETAFGFGPKTNSKNNNVNLQRVIGIKLL